MILVSGIIRQKWRTPQIMLKQQQDLMNTISTSSLLRIDIIELGKGLEGSNFVAENAYRECHYISLQNIFCCCCRFSPY